MPGHLDAKDVEIAVLRRQLAVLHRQVARPRYKGARIELDARPEGPSEQEEKSGSPVGELGASVVALDGECRDPEVVGFLSELPEGSRWDVACRALSVGVVGLKAMGVAGHLEVVERELLALKQGFGSALEDVENRPLERIDLTSTRPGSVSVGKTWPDDRPGACRSGESRPRGGVQARHADH
jgi:hypothetical protein